MLMLYFILLCNPTQADKVSKQFILDVKTSDHQMKSGGHAPLRWIIL